MKKHHIQKVLVTRPVLMAVLGLMILGISLNLAKNKANINRQATNSYLPPLEVKVVNQYESGFSVSWLTIEQTKGYVVYGTNQDEVINSSYQSPKASDIRGDNTYYSHLVSINNLRIGERYYFKIISNDQVYFLALDNYWREAGIPDSVKLPENSGQKNGALSLESDALSGCSGLPDYALISCYRPNPVWGQVVKPDNQPAADTLVYIDIPNKTNTIATVTGNDGRWVMNLSNLWQIEGKDYASYQPGVDLIRVTASGKDTKSSVYQPISSVVDQIKQNTSPISLNLITAPLVNPEITTTPTPTLTPSPILNPTPTSTLTPTQPAVQNQVTLTITLPQKKAATLSGTVEFKNKYGRWSNVRITLRNINTNQYQGTTSFGQTGEYEIAFQPDGYLKTSLGKYTIQSGQNTITNTNTLWLGGDLNKDNRINSIDVGLLLVNYQKAKSFLTSADLDGDGMINIIDLAMLMSNYNGI